MVKKQRPSGSPEASSEPLELSQQRHQDIERLRRQCLVELDAVHQLYAWLDDKRECRRGCRILGDSRTGKTFACEAYRFRHSGSQSSGDVPLLPVVYWQATAEAGQRELFVGLLNDLRYRVTGGTLNDLRERVYRMLRASGVEMVILDEAHRFRHKALQEIQDILDKVKVSVVLVGTDRLDAVLRHDDQVLNRFLPCFQFQRFDRQALADTTAIWEEWVLKLPEPSHLTSPSVQQLLGSVTRGYLGHLDEILRNAARRALQQGQSRIELSLLHQVVQEYKGHGT